MNRPVLAFVFLCLCFGTTFGAIAIMLRDGWPPLLAAAVRFSISSVIVLAIARRVHGPIPWPSRRELAIAAFVGLTVTGATFGALYTAETTLASGLAAILSATGPLFAFSIAVARGARRITVSSIAGIAVGTLGVALVVGVDALHVGAGATLGAFAIIVSEFLFAAGLTAIRASTLPTLYLSAAQQLIGGLTLLALSLVIEHRAPAHAGAAGTIALLYLIVVATAVAHSIGAWLARVTNATFASSWTYVSPLIALAFGMTFLHERAGLGALLGGVFVIAGAFMLNSAELLARRKRSSAARAEA